tara:strand:+ start:82 stop:387 length:306 start_codon:yes stop_codon:yes gene_type:complete
MAWKHKYNQWKQDLEEQQQSGLSAREYCLRKGISYKAFFYRKRRLSEFGNSVETGSFIEVQIDQQPITSSGIVLRQGTLEITLDRDFDAVTLKKVLKVLPC